MTAGIRANSRGLNALRAMQTRAQDATSVQANEGERAARVSAPENSTKTRDSAGAGFANSSFSNDMQGSAADAANSLSRKAFAASSLRGFERLADGENAARKCKKRKPSARASMLIRWCKFNVVGAIGILVQFAALFFLKSVMHCNYLAATALAVEAAVVHNFLWHERYTWAERVGNPSGAEARNLLRTLIAALKRCATQNLLATQNLRSIQDSCDSQNPCGPPNSCGGSVGRFLRFNLTTGLVSIAGNLGMMWGMAGRGHMNYLVANAVAIAVCSLANFLVSEGWVFGE